MSAPRKIDVLTAMTADASVEGEVRLAIGEPPEIVGCNPAVAALLESSKFANLKKGYGDVRGTAETVDSLRALFKADYGIDDAIDVMITNGATEALRFVFEYCLDKFDEVILPTPFYPGHHTFIENAQLRCIPLPPSTERFNVEGLRATLAANPHAKMIVFSQNPSGIALTVDEWQQIVEILKQYPHLKILLDEAYRELNQSYATLFDLGDAVRAEFKQRCFIVKSLSKTLAGDPLWRGGMMAGPTDEMAKIIARSGNDVSKLTQAISVAAIESRLGRHPAYAKAHQDYLEWNRRCQDYYRYNIDMMREGLTALNLRVPMPDGGIFIQVDASSLKGKCIPDTMSLEITPDKVVVIEQLHAKIGASTFRDDADIQLFFAQAARVVGVSGTAFGYQPEDCMLRFSCAKETSELMCAIDQLTQAINTVLALEHVLGAESMLKELSIFKDLSSTRTSAFSKFCKMRL